MPRVTITAPDKTPQPYRFKLDREVVTLGRGSDNDIVIECGSVSVKHAEMRRVGGGYELRDAGSTNGIKVDGERQDMVKLRSGMQVLLGDVPFDFELSEEEMDTLGGEKTASREIELPPLKESSDEGAPESGERPASRSGGCGLGMVLLFLILAAAAFLAGMAVRYQKETGGSLLESLLARTPAAAAEKADADGNPDAETPPPAAEGDSGEP